MSDETDSLHPDDMVHFDVTQAQADNLLWALHWAMTNAEAREMPAIAERHHETYQTIIGQREAALARGNDE